MSVKNVVEARKRTEKRNLKRMICLKPMICRSKPLESSVLNACLQRSKQGIDWLALAGFGWKFHTLTHSQRVPDVGIAQ